MCVSVCCTCNANGKLTFPLTDEVAREKERTMSFSIAVEGRARGHEKAKVIDLGD